ncbi:MAG: DUF2007 domain-containing protein [Deltaproteobacteria bacterium]|nr:DUF2007 domain-containing protein [Deltaproteobacteria bacterium]
MTSTDKVDLVRVESRVAAIPIQQYLEAHGIHCTIDADDVNGLDPALAFVQGVGVQVGADHLTRARELYKAYETGSLQEGWEDEIDTVRKDAD